ncbi:hypothetical protein IC1_04268 [Bacillus cereus VD022]|uniref:Lipoprotein n=1 Tax=Bacillus cereus TIAC219 TaxID=718222 RepID=A0ABC9SUC9_BACCE|nr:hypothetical protein IC1_04268 [Bacillus cereus VD022]EOQ59521.1 hypothetical protein IAY_03794 [Bacillus cereus TIAC219]
MQTFIVAASMLLLFVGCLFFVTDKCFRSYGQ